MPIDANTIASIHMLNRDGRYNIPADSGLGPVGRPRAHGQQGGQIASLETFFDYFINNVPPPDEAKQLDPDIETKIRMHPDVVASYTKREFSVSAMPWRIDANKDAPDQHVAQQVAKYCAKVVRSLPNFEQAIEHLQYAVLVGGQGLELVWHQDADGREYPISFHPVHMSRFLFDRLGNMALLTRDYAVWGVYVSSDPRAKFQRALPRGNFIYHIYKQGQGIWEKPQLEGYRYYGYGLDVGLYYVITFDVFCLKFRMKFLERWGMPPTVLYYPENRAATGEILHIVNSLRGESVISCPKLMGSGVNDNVNSLYKVEQLPTPTGSYDFFEGFSERYTKPRVDAIILGSAEETQKQDGKGGYSDHVSRRDTGPNVWFKRDARNISSTLTHQLMPAIALGRFPNLPAEYWPSFVLEPKEEKDRMQELEIIEAGSKLVPIPQDYVYETSGLPKPKKGEQIIGGQQQQQPGMQPPAIAGTPHFDNGKTRDFSPQEPSVRRGIGQSLMSGAAADRLKDE